VERNVVEGHLEFGSFQLEFQQTKEERGIVACMMGREDECDLMRSIRAKRGGGRVRGRG
jgi:hypothetical protein